MLKSYSAEAALVPIVSGFASHTLLMQHYSKHNPWDFQYKDASEYLNRAKAFLEADLAVIGAEECIDPQSGDTVRYSRITEEFAVVNPQNAIRTYYKPKPRHLAPPGWPPLKVHSQATNYDYFKDNC